MEKISRDYFDQMSIRQIWGYLERLQESIEKYENRISDMYGFAFRQEAELQKLRDVSQYLHDCIDHYRQVTGVVLSSTTLLREEW